MHDCSSEIHSVNVWNVLITRLLVSVAILKRGVRELIPVIKYEHKNTLTTKEIELQRPL